MPFNWIIPINMKHMNGTKLIVSSHVCVLSSVEAMFRIVVNLESDHRVFKRCRYLYFCCFRQSESKLFERETIIIIILYRIEFYKRNTCNYYTVTVWQLLCGIFIQNVHDTNSVTNKQ